MLPIDYVLQAHNPVGILQSFRRLTRVYAGKPVQLHLFPYLLGYGDKDQQYPEEYVAAWQLQDQPVLPDLLGRQAEYRQNRLPFNCLRKGRVVIIHDKLENITATSARKTMKNLFGFINGKRRCVLFVKRTEAKRFCPVFRSCTYRPM